ncbi:MAG: thioredoxin family protein [Marinilabiliales bacterium]
MPEIAVNMKKLLFFLVVFTLISPVSLLKAQLLDPVHWNYYPEKINDNEYYLVFQATIDDDWHLYSQFTPEGGPLPTEFEFTEPTNYSVIDKALEIPDPIKEFDKSFNIDVLSFTKKATFKQKIKLQNPNVNTQINGIVYYQVCNDETCVPWQHDFNLIITAIEKSSDDSQEVAVNDSNLIEKDTTDTELIAGDTNKTANDSVITSNTTNQEIKQGSETLADKFNNASLWGFFLLAFIGGLVALLTPCVYPMIPMTVSFFMHNADNRSKAVKYALVYGISIVLIYIIIGTIVSITMGEDFTNWLSTHWLPNILFFLLFVIFAASFFGMFEITLPSWLINKSDAQADRGGYIGSFFMGLTLVLVSFSCTVPIVGYILRASADGQVLKPIIGMFGFSLAFALPFTLFAISPSWLKSLPKSGGWLNSVKVVLGFLELALALKFLSVADQTYHWRILDREVYIALWIAIFSLMGLYLLGKIKFAHDSDLPYIKVPRLLLAIVTFSFVVYLIPGMFGAPLKMLSGFLPPQQTIDFDIERMVRESGNNCSNENKTLNTLCETPKYSDFLHLPHSLKGYFDYEQALACAKEQNKPIFIDFTGHGCVNCREMEANVWSDPRVLKLLREKFVIVALYVDDKTSLAKEDQVISKYDNKLKTTIGAKNIDFEIYHFNFNAQPYYVLLDNKTDLSDPNHIKNNLLVPPRAYDLDVDAFLEFLNNGLKEFEKRQEKH